MAAQTEIRYVRDPYSFNGWATVQMPSQPSTPKSQSLSFNSTYFPASFSTTSFLSTQSLGAGWHNLMAESRNPPVDPRIGTSTPPETFSPPFSATPTPSERGMAAASAMTHSLAGAPPLSARCPATLRASPWTVVSTSPHNKNAKAKPFPSSESYSSLDGAQDEQGSPTKASKSPSVVYVPIPIPVPFPMWSNGGKPILPKDFNNMKFNQTDLAVPQPFSPPQTSMTARRGSVMSRTSLTSTPTTITEKDVAEGELSCTHSGHHYDGDHNDQETKHAPTSPDTPMMSSGCEHFTKWRRLRIKKGQNHMLCTECGVKWRCSVKQGTHYPTSNFPRNA